MGEEREVEQTERTTTEVEGADGERQMVETEETRSVETSDSDE